MTDILTDRELIAQAREVARALFAGSGSDRNRWAAGLLKELADRLEGRPAAQATEDSLGEAEARAWCKRCEHGTASVPCPRCGGPACAGCGRCPPCDGPVDAAQDTEDSHG